MVEWLQLSGEQFIVLAAMLSPIPTPPPSANSTYLYILIVIYNLKGSWLVIIRYSTQHLPVHSITLFKNPSSLQNRNTEANRIESLTSQNSAPMAAVSRDELSILRGMSGWKIYFSKLEMHVTDFFSQVTA